MTVRAMSAAPRTVDGGDALSGRALPLASSWAINIVSPTTPGVYRYWLGYAEDAGYTVDQVALISDAAIAASTANYYSFQPVMGRRAADGTYKVVAVGSSIATSGNAILADTPTRAHVEKSLDARPPKDAIFGVQITVTGGGTATNIGFIAAVNHAR